MAVMSAQKKPFKAKQLKAKLTEELNFLKNVFSVLTLPAHSKDENDDVLGYEMGKGKKERPDGPQSKRARTITELEERLGKLKSQSNHSLKAKLVKKSLNSKLSKKLKKQERLNKTKIKPINKPVGIITPKLEEEKKPAPAKPVFNNDGKLVFSKFDFANIGRQEKGNKGEKDPRKLLENMEKQKEKLRQLEEKDGDKVKVVKEKMAWKNVLQKAEGQKVKDDPVLLKKSIKRLDQKKKHSKKQWDARIESVQKKKDDKQKKRRENIMKKKKEKKTKVVKASAKRGRVVIPK